MARPTRDPQMPSFAECRDWADELDSLWSAGAHGGLIGRWAIEEELYFQTFALQVVQGERGVRVGSAPSDVDASVDGVTPIDLRVNVEPARRQQKYRDQADLLTRGGTSLLRLWRARQDVLRQIASDQCLYAVGVSRVLFDDRLWPARPEADSWVDDAEALADWEVAKRREVPITMQRRNAKHCRWKLDEHGKPLIVIEDYETTVLEALRVFGYLGPARKLLDKLGDRRQPVRVQDVWFGRYRCVMLNQEPVFPVNGSGAYRGVAPHGYPEIPYCFAPYREMPGETPEARYRGVLTNQMSVYPAESQAVTMHMTMLRFNAWRTFVAHVRDQRDIEIRPGKVIEIDKRFGEYLELLGGEPVSPEVIQTAQVLQGYRFQNGVGQLGMGNTDSARSAQQVMAQQSLAEKKILPARKSLEALCAGALRLAMMIIQDVIAEPITLPSPGRNREGQWQGQVRIRPEDINGYWDKFEVNFTRRLDPAQLEQAKALAALSEANWMPWETSVELSGFCDVPGEWYDALLLQAVERQPYLQELGAMEMLEAYYQDSPQNQWKIDQFRARLAQERGAPPALPQGGMPGAPAGLPGGMGNPTNTLAGMAGTGQINPPAAMGTGGPSPQGGTPPMQQQPLPHRRGNQGGAGRPFRNTGVPPP